MNFLILCSPSWYFINSAFLNNLTLKNKYFRKIERRKHAFG